MMDCLGINSDDEFDARSASSRTGGCTCFTRHPYDRLEEHDSSDQEPLMLTFYANETDRHGIEVMVEKDLCAVDLCTLIILKAGYKSNTYWSIVEFWATRSYERVLEDHEYILAVYYNMKKFAGVEEVRYIYRQVIEKYDFYQYPLRYFEALNVVVDHSKYFRRKLDTYLAYLFDEGLIPTVFSTLHLRQHGRWHRVHLLLRHGIVYLCKEDYQMKMWNYMASQRKLIGGFNTMRELSDEDLVGLSTLGHLAYFQIYIEKKKSTAGKPEPESTLFILRPSVRADATTSEKSVYRFCCPTYRERLSWVAAMRLAKYGKLLRDNYRAFKDKQPEFQVRDYSTQDVPRERDEVMEFVEFPGRSSAPTLPPFNPGPSTSRGAIPKIPQTSKRSGTRNRIRRAFTNAFRTILPNSSSSDEANDSEKVKSAGSIAEASRSDQRNTGGTIRKVINSFKGKQEKPYELDESEEPRKPENSGIEGDDNYIIVSAAHQSSLLERESVRSRVAMDFTGKTGRIVEDPVEAREIALGVGYMRKRRDRIVSRRPANSRLNENRVDVGVHTTQPWFHRNLTRDQASTLVTKYGNGDGIFIVRPSRTSKGTFVLTYRCQGKLVHLQIVPMIDRENNVIVYSMDNGQTKFYDLLQLVEFHTVNLGSLMCRLTHYVTENANIINSNGPSTSNAAEHVNVAVNTDLSLIEEDSENANRLGSNPGSSKTKSL